MRQSGSAFLFLVVAGSFDHLIVRRFFETAGNQMGAECFVVLFKPGTRHAVSILVRHAVAVAQVVHDFIGIFRRRDFIDAGKFAASLFPVRFRKFVGIAFIDQRNLPRPLLDRLGSRRAHAISVH